MKVCYALTMNEIQAKCRHEWLGDGGDRLICTKCKLIDDSPTKISRWELGRQGKGLRDEDPGWDNIIKIIEDGVK